MNSFVTFPASTPNLKLVRPSTEKWAATVNEERRRLQDDQEMLREREGNLREYEARLRNWQAELDAGRAAVRPVETAPVSASVAAQARSGSHTPFVDDTALHAAWDKLHRARELLEAEQNHLRDDRMMVADQNSALKRREEAVAAREAAVAAREALVAAAMDEQPVRTHAATEQTTASKMSRLTRAPFDMARSVFGGKR